MRQLIIAPQGTQNIRRLQAGRGTGRTGGHRQILDRHDHRLAFDVSKAHVQIVRHTMLKITVDVSGLDIPQAIEQLVTQRAYTLVFLDHFLLGQTESLAHANNLMRRQGARAETTLMATTMHLGLKANTRLATHVQCANTFRAVGFMRREAHQIDLQFLQVNINLAGRLGGIDMEDNALLAADFTQFGYRLDNTNFIVHEHDRSQYGVRANGRLENIQVEQAILLDIEIGRFESLALHLTHGVEHRLVLGLHSDDVLTLGAGVEVSSPLDGEVVGFGGTGCPNNLLGIGIDQGCDLFASLLDSRISFPAKTVRTRSGITKLLNQVRNHFVRHTRVNRGGCRVIQIDGEFHRHSR